MRFHTSLVLLSTYLGGFCSYASIIVNEIARAGTSNVCSGHDWVELYNNSTEAIDLSNGYILHDDKGAHDSGAFHFPVSTQLQPHSYLLLCTKLKSRDADLAQVPDPTTPQFGIGKGDTITLLKVTNSTTSEQAVTRSVSYQIVSSVGPLPDDLETDAFDLTYALDPVSHEYAYTSTPTPGASNVMTDVPTTEERAQTIRARLAKQNALGTAFFNMDDQGLPVLNGMPGVLDLYLDMLEEDVAYITEKAYEELYRPFQRAKLLTIEGEEIATFNSPGRIRPKGQSTLYASQCLGVRTMPFQVDMDRKDANQTLFGIERFFLRHHLADNSYIRDWSYHRMLARFGLPHLRARHVRLYINEELYGFYTLLEAPEQEYVFARNFDSYAPEHNPAAIYKFTNLGAACGQYSEKDIANAATRLDEAATPPYAFERGDHRRPIDVLGIAGAVGGCHDNYIRDVEVLDREDVVLAWLRYNRDCAKMRMEEGLVDRKFGSSDLDDTMEDFLREHLDRANDSCNPGCTNSHLQEDVDVASFLKTIAFYAVTLGQDSPLGPGHNYYLVQTGDGKGWKLQAYDFNYPYPVHCPVEVCNERLVHWSITRPTCRSLEENPLVGPLLSEPDLHKQYLGYVKDFVNNVYGSSSLVEQMTSHVNYIRVFAAGDVFGTYGAYFEEELSPDAAEWNTGRFPLLPTMKARTSDVQAQLTAIEGGTFPRGHMVGLHEDDEPWEVCTDWRSNVPHTSECTLGCQYNGCNMPGWAVESYCDEETGTCYHGDYDESCQNIVNGDQYPGMQNRPDGRETFCRFAAGVPVKVSECPAVTRESFAGDTTDASSEAWSSHSSVGSWVVSLSIVLLASINIGL
ncbi:spore coat protein CotH [Seminavis robusta]|uniref:Spore coat protein CotH n=1 Tax=Seminavis robusta TaxID=568900 RepID=A0A9N8EQ55_9STRA|nr:spore coat protein CotH [Seminavis robusta]|eukprot:Sro1328_g263200.1 spore coat protein CotH (855) ;mRNA; f:15968-18614